MNDGALVSQEGSEVELGLVGPNFDFWSSNLQMCFLLHVQGITYACANVLEAFSLADTW